MGAWKVYAEKSLICGIGHLRGEKARHSGSLIGGDSL